MKELVFTLELDTVLPVKTLLSVETGKYDNGDCYIFFSNHLINQCGLIHVREDRYDLLFDELFKLNVHEWGWSVEHRYLWGDDEGTSWKIQAKTDENMAFTQNLKQSFISGGNLLYKNKNEWNAFISLIDRITDGSHIYDCYNWDSIKKRNREINDKWRVENRESSSL